MNRQKIIAAAGAGVLVFSAAFYRVASEFWRPGERVYRIGWEIRHFKSRARMVNPLVSASNWFEGRLSGEVFDWNGP
jgi:hypothetical protein